MNRDIKALELAAGRTPFRPIISGDLTLMKLVSVFLYTLNGCKVDRHRAMEYLRVAR